LGARCQSLSVTETSVGARPQSLSLKHGRVVIEIMNPLPDRQLSPWS
jgi:hypothetical protein